MLRFFKFIAIIAVCAACVSCRTDESIVMPDSYMLGTPRDVTDFAVGEPHGFFILNQGNMGSNKATIDFGDFVTANYLRNLYPSRNPSVVKELGDVGNDLKIYGNRLYAVINASHKVEVMDLEARRIGQVDIPNCRYIGFKDNRGYVTSFVGGIGDADSPHGAVYEIDLENLAVLRTVSVGYQPEQLLVVGDRIYVVNSGGYIGYENPELYERTISVVDISTMAVVSTITLDAVNLQRIALDASGQMWVQAQGDYIAQQATLLVAKPPYDTFEDLELPCANFAIHGSKLYTYSNAYSGGTAYRVIDTATHAVTSQSIITDGTDKDIATPYLIAVNPYSGDILIGDAKNYVSSGSLSCYTPSGTLRWRVTTGDIPAALAFVY